MRHVVQACSLGSPQSDLVRTHMCYRLFPLRIAYRVLVSLCSRTDDDLGNYFDIHRRRGGFLILGLWLKRAACNPDAMSKAIQTGSSMPSAVVSSPVDLYGLTFSLGRTPFLSRVSRPQETSPTRQNVTSSFVHNQCALMPKLPLEEAWCEQSRHRCLKWTGGYCRETFGSGLSSTAALGRSQSYAPELHPPLRQSRDDRWIPIHTVHKRVCQTFLRHWKVHNNAYLPQADQD